MYRKAIISFSFMFVLLLAAIFPVQARQTSLQPSDGQQSRVTRAAIKSQAGGTCPVLKTDGKVSWLQVQDNEATTTAVDSYPSGATMIVSAFDYTCMPAKTTIITVYYYPDSGSDPVFTDKSTPAASATADQFVYPLSRDDNSALGDGLWQVEFYNGKKMIASGEVTIGGTQTTADSVTITGTVIDKRTKKGINGATVVVLKPGITYDQWDTDQYTEDDVYTYADTNSRGVFNLPDQLQRGTVYTLIAGADGYKPVGSDDFQVTNDDPDPLELNITLSK